MFEEPFPILYVRDMDRSLQFYRDLLGFHTKFRWPGEGAPEYVYLTLGTYGIGLSPQAVGEAMTGRPITREGGPQCEICLYTPDVDSAAAHLRAHGVEELVPPTTRPWGERNCYFVDPDGNPIHIAGPAAQGEVG